MSRSWIALARLLPFVLLASLPGGCGFHLRGTGGTEFAVDRIHVSATNAYGELQNEIERTLMRSGAEIGTLTESRYSLSVISERFSRRPVSTTSQISVAEYELNLQVVFELTAGNGEALVPRSTLSLDRIYTFDAESLVGSSEEEAVLQEEMRREAAGRLVQQIDAAVRTRQAESQ